MALRHACSPALQVASCHGYLIRNFVAASRAELGAGLSTRTARLQPWRSTVTLRPYSTRVANNRAADTPFAAVEANDLLQPERSDISPVADEDSPLPWYLRPSHSPSTSSPLPRQSLPTLPPHPPPLLGALLSHLSLDLGLDDISLLDLRSLDPPAALGSNLLMLLCTARSEKHLHVSADRLCRWLRSAHALRPFADGLLGRNELKLRAKRKAKRARLLSSVGAKARDTDEVRTGWVCVNLGVVEGGVLPPTEPESEAEVVGFRTEEQGCRIVVQMMTDDKRGALDLESLWTGIVNRSNAAKDDGAQKPPEPEKPKPAFDNPFPEAKVITHG